jgi:hypothetical protein
VSTPLRGWPRAWQVLVVLTGALQVQYRRLVLRAHHGQGARLPQHQPGHRQGVQGVQGVALARPPGALARLRRPAGADLVDRLAGRDQVLGQPPAVAPGALDAPPAGRAQAGGPRQQVAPPRRAVGPPPAPDLAPGVVERDGLVQPLVGVDPQGQHPCPPPLVGARARSRGRHHSLESAARRPASIRPAPAEPGGGATHHNQGTRRRGQLHSGSAHPAALCPSYRELRSRLALARAVLWLDVAKVRSRPDSSVALRRRPGRGSGGDEGTS